jgi:hypothetical protein
MKKISDLVLDIDIGDLIPYVLLIFVVMQLLYFLIF